MQKFSVLLSVMQSFEHVVEVLVFQHRIDCRLHVVSLFRAVIVDLKSSISKFN